MEIAAVTFIIGFILGGCVAAFIAWRASISRVAIVTEHSPFANM